MPDVFVAPEEKKNVVMHKRIPLPTQAQIAVKQVTETSSSSQPIVEDAPEEEPSSQKPTLHIPTSVAAEHSSGGAIPLFASFWQNPRGVYFDTQEANEHILLFLRQHFITNIPWIFLTTVLLFVPLGLGYVLSITKISFTFLPTSFIAVILAFYYVIVLTNAFTSFLKWYYNISLITPQRMLDIEFNDLVDKKIVATKMSLVQDASAQYAGTLRTVFNFADVLIQTAGPIDNFVINATPRPEVVVRTVEELIGKGREEGENAV